MIKFKILGLMLAVIPLIHYKLRAAVKNDITVTVDSASGNYLIRSERLKWTFRGTTGQPLHGIAHTKGADDIGQFNAVSFKWNDGTDYTGTIKWYSENPVVLFSLELPAGAGKSVAAFPHFTGIPSTPYHFSYKDVDFAPPTFSLNETSTPWLLFDGDLRACILSPASDFIVSRISGDGTTDIASGLNPEVQKLPAGFTHSTLLVMDQGIGNTWDQWGRALRSLYHRTRPANDADAVLKYYGYWTDNGADYYYNYDTSKGYNGTLVALRDYYKQQHIPLGYMQLDSWWYEKSIVDPRGKPDADHKNPRLPKGPWNRYGGLMEYRADPFLFPDGLVAFAEKVQLPFVTHNRWIDPQSPYQRMYKVSGYAGTGMGYWNDIMGYIKSFGAICYEQDWLNYIYEKSPEMISDPAVGNAFTDGMARAAAANGLDMQYCMALPRFFLQGVKYDNLTTIRTSGDRFQPAKWRHFLLTTRLAYEVGIWPWCDVFKSPETGNMIVSVLSAGAVGTGDAIGTEDKANIMKACRADGILVKPDVPLMPMDQDYLQAARDEAKPFLASTYTLQGEVKTGYVFAFGDKDTKSDRFSFSPAALGLKGKTVVFDPLTAKLKELDADDQFEDRLPAEKYAYYIIAPVTSSGIAFLGDAGKIAATGKKRIAAIDPSAKELKVTVLFARGDQAVTLQGYCRRPVFSSEGQLSQDGKTHLFTLHLPAPEKGGKVTVRLTTK
jgi:hypothetical protein